MFVGVLSLLWRCASNFLAVGDVFYCDADGYRSMVIASQYKKMSPTTFAFT
jgi:hypothetical protein